MNTVHRYAIIGLYCDSIPICLASMPVFSAHYFDFVIPVEKSLRQTQGVVLCAGVVLRREEVRNVYDVHGLE
jgi:hypothetical protein